MSAVDVLLARVQGAKPRGLHRWVARCPAHKDRSPSLSIRELDDGRVLIHDFGGCSVESVLDSLGLTCRDLFPERLADHLARVPNAGSHAHAAADALKVMAREAGVLVLAAQDLAAGALLSPKDRARMLEAALRIRGAARMV